MAAERQQAEAILGGEFAQAHGAIERLFGAEDLSVGEDGEKVNEGLVEAGVVEVEELLQLPLQAFGGGRGVAAAICVERRGGRGGRGRVLLYEEPH